MAAAHLVQGKGVSDEHQLLDAGPWTSSRSPTSLLI
jgi:hypothetical protein